MPYEGIRDRCRLRFIFRRCRDRHFYLNRAVGLEWTVNKTSIEWTDYTWNPIRARNTRANRVGTFCTRISPGCKNCYASTINRRFGTGLEYDAQELKHHEFFISDKILAEPIERKKPARIFVGDMFDLFHESIPFEMIGRVFETMHRADWHIFQVLTKRADRMRQFHNYRRPESPNSLTWGELTPDHIHLGVSVEDQKRALERIPKLQETPAAVRFLSVEPQLEHIDLGHDTPEVGWISYLRGFDGCDPVIPGIDWVICGGESGPGARPFNLAWAESLLAQCRAAGVPFFMKQLGSNPGLAATEPMQTLNDGRVYGWPYPHKDRKGGDPAEWPESLRVREFPAAKSTFSAEMMRCSQ
jgi:protein gp37